jgi:gas vesicle protein
MLKAIQRFTEGKLRKESGAAIGVSEYFSTAQMFFPDPGDTTQNEQTLASARNNIINGMVGASGKAAPIYYAAVVSLPEVQTNPYGDSTTVKNAKSTVQQTGDAIQQGAQWLQQQGQAWQGKAADATQNVANQAGETVAQKAEEVKKYVGYTSDAAKKTIDDLRAAIPDITEDEIKQALKDINIIQ